MNEKINVKWNEGLPLRDENMNFGSFKVVVAYLDDRGHFNVAQASYSYSDGKWIGYSCKLPVEVLIGWLPIDTFNLTEYPSSVN